ncbi:MAG: aldo/keto reductase [Ruminococcaceae bacterium]|nr:aldo/keto reductase [Oscillospiraceae bacterium]
MKEGQTIMLQLTTQNMPLSRVILGSAYFGTTIDDEHSFAMLDLYYALGGRTIDTARVYGAWSGHIGDSEKTIGRWLALRGHKDVIVITKCAHPAPDDRSKGRLDPESIREDLERSADALGRAPDWTLLHRDDTGRPVEEILESLNRGLSDGLTQRIGCSNWYVSRVNEANAAAAAHGMTGFTLSEILWSLGATTPALQGDPTLVCMDGTEYEGYMKNGIPVLAFSSQAKGYFSKMIAGGEASLSEKSRARFAQPVNKGRLERLTSFCKSRELSPSAVVLACITCNALPACAIIGCSNETQLADSMQAADLKLSLEEVRWLFSGK